MNNLTYTVEHFDTVASIGNGWWNTGIGATIHDIMKFIAGLLMIFAIVNLIVKGIKGEWGKGLRGLLGGLLLASLLVYPAVVDSALNVSQQLVKRIVDTVGQADDGNGGSVGGTTNGNGNG